jgi:hypothetical protein
LALFVGDKLALLAGDKLASFVGDKLALFAGDKVALFVGDELVLFRSDKLAEENVEQSRRASEAWRSSLVSMSLSATFNQALEYNLPRGVLDSSRHRGKTNSLIQSRFIASDGTQCPPQILIAFRDQAFSSSSSLLPLILRSIARQQRCRSSGIDSQLDRLLLICSGRSMGEPALPQPLLLVSRRPSSQAASSLHNFTFRPHREIVDLHIVALSVD